MDANKSSFFLFFSIWKKKHILIQDTQAQQRHNKMLTPILSAKPAMKLSRESASIVPIDKEGKIINRDEAQEQNKHKIIY